MLGLGLLGVHDLGAWAWRWIVVDVIWAVMAGLVIGGGLGTAIGQLVLYLRRTHREALRLDDFLTLGLIALAYGVALACHAYGFLAVFAAGLALRRIECRTGDPALRRCVGGRFLLSLHCAAPAIASVRMNRWGEQPIAP